MHKNVLRGGCVVLLKTSKKKPTFLDCLCVCVCVEVGQLWTAGGSGFILGYHRPTCFQRCWFHSIRTAALQEEAQEPQNGYNMNWWKKTPYFEVEDTWRADAFNRTQRNQQCFLGCVLDYSVVNDSLLVIAKLQAVTHLEFGLLCVM